MCAERKYGQLKTPSNTELWSKDLSDFMQLYHVRTWWNDSLLSAFLSTLVTILIHILVRWSPTLSIQHSAWNTAGSTYLAEESGNFFKRYPKINISILCLNIHRIVRIKFWGTCSQSQDLFSDCVSLGKPVISPGLSFLTCRVDQMVFKISLALTSYDSMKLASCKPYFTIQSSSTINIQANIY